MRHALLAILVFVQALSVPLVAWGVQPVLGCEITACCCIDDGTCPCAVERDESPAPANEDFAAPSASKVHPFPIAPERAITQTSSPERCPVHPTATTHNSRAPERAVLCIWRT